ncbi:unnamed protein product [Brachionus calyciflorus]|uniref:Uncharacterized protein n=1 Tax=Brachionus calyciflorus TaxID=104777 RepID=A0A813MA75_9BILA|nr:unnamed protein product [Brachionus calyciflorus]
MDSTESEILEIRWSYFVSEYFRLRKYVSSAIDNKSGKTTFIFLDYHFKALYLYGETYLKIDKRMFQTFEAVYNQLLEENYCNELEENETGIIGYYKYIERINENNKYA